MMVRACISALAFCCLFGWNGGVFAQQGNVTPGIEVLLGDSLHLLEGKRVGVICNHTSVLRNGTHVVDALLSTTRVTLAAIFTPEHGFRGSASAGEHVASERLNSIPVYSLYGNARRPSAEMMNGVDVLVFDMQDVGARFYTYISTMGYCMEAAAARNIPMIICDRPNPIRGDVVQGPTLDLKHKSFVGLYPIPVRHGMTVAEIARMAAGEGWLEVTGLRLHVIPMSGWRRAMWYDETGISWIAPSPNIPDLATAILYPGMCFVEGTNLSEGRGTDTPFQIAGAPFLNKDAFTAAVLPRWVHGARVTPVFFTPKSRQGAGSPKHEGKQCGGVRILVMDRDVFNPIFAGVAVLAAAIKAAPKAVKETSYLPLLTGKPMKAASLQSEIAIQSMLDDWSKEAATFLQQREPYLLYK